MIRKMLVAVAMVAGAVSSAASAHAALYWTPWVSEEGGGPWTACRAWNEGAVGFGCSGSYCDNVRMLCETFPSGITLQPESDFHTAWFSEEGAPPPGIGSTQPTPNQGVCRYFIPGSFDSFRPGVMSGIHCSGSNCDNSQLECDLPVKYDGATPVPALATRCHTVGPISEEQGSQDFGANQYVTSVECTGKFCDNKTFTVCSFAAPF